MQQTFYSFFVQYQPPGMDEYRNIGVVTCDITSGAMDFRVSTEWEAVVDWEGDPAIQSFEQLEEHIGYLVSRGSSPDLLVQKLRTACNPLLKIAPPQYSRGQEIESEVQRLARLGGIRMSDRHEVLKRIRIALMAASLWSQVHRFVPIGGPRELNPPIIDFAFHCTSGLRLFHAFSADNSPMRFNRTACAFLKLRSATQLNGSQVSLTAFFSPTEIETSDRFILAMRDELSEGGVEIASVSDFSEFAKKWKDDMVVPFGLPSNIKSSSTPPLEDQVSQTNPLDALRTPYQRSSWMMQR